MSGILQRMKLARQRKIESGIAPEYKRPAFKRPSDMKNDVWLKTNGRCFYCGCNLLPYGNEKISFTIDHAIPLAKGGTNEIDNLVPSCKTCNSRKGAR